MFISNIFKTKSIKTLGKKTLIGEGSYGCVIKPAVVDKYEKIYIEYNDISDNDVGKLFRSIGEESFKKELKILKGINKIDPNGTFTVKLKGANAFNEKILLNQDTKIRKCLDINERTFEDKILIYQIIIENGGNEVTNVPKNSIHYESFINMLHVFLEGIKYMKSVNLVHRDIKPPNVLISDTKISLIDFGISEEADKVFSKENIDYLSYMYPYYPPEFFISSLLMKYRNDKERFLEKLDTIIEYLEENYLNEMFKQKKIYSIINDIQDFINEIKLRNYSFHDVFNKEMAYKTDIYGISFIINEIANKIIYSNEKQKIAIYTLYKKCSEINPYKRVTIEQLLEYIKEIKNITFTSGGSKKKKNNKQLKPLVIPKIHKTKINKEIKLYKKKTPYILKLSIKLKIK